MPKTTLDHIVIIRQQRCPDLYTTAYSLQAQFLAEDNVGGVAPEDGFEDGNVAGCGCGLENGLLWAFENGGWIEEEALDHFGGAEFGGFFKDEAIMFIG